MVRAEMERERLRLTSAPTSGGDYRNTATPVDSTGFGIESSNPRPNIPSVSPIPGAAGPPAAVTTNSHHHDNRSHTRFRFDSHDPEKQAAMLAKQRQQQEMADALRAQMVSAILILILHQSSFLLLIGNSIFFV